MKNYVCRKCTGNVDIQKYHKMCYRNKFFMKSDQETEELSPSTIAKQQAEVSLTLHNAALGKWKLLVKDWKRHITKWRGFKY